MSYRRKVRTRPQNPTFTLNITSMTDMFTMLLVFLLQSFAASNVIIETEHGLSLPMSNSLMNPTNGTQVLVGKSTIKVDGEIIAQFDSGALKTSDLDPKNKHIIAPLLSSLKAKLEKIEAAKAVQGSEQGGQSVPKDDTILLQADSSWDMARLEPYLTTISAAGFAKVKLATVVGR